MSKLSDVAKASARSSFYLFIGRGSSTIIMALTSFLVARLLGPENYGLYTVALIVPSFLIALSDLGISPALTRFSAQLRSEGKEQKAASLIKIGISFKLLLTLILSLLLLLLSQHIATTALKRPEITLLISLASLYLVGQAVLNTVNSTYVGLDQTEKNGFLLNIQAIARAVASPLLILLGLGAIGATLGAGLSLLLASGIGVSLLLLRTTPTLYRRGHMRENIDFSQGLRLMVGYGMPLYISAFAHRLLIEYRSFTLALFTSNVEIGNYTAAMNFSTLITLLTTPIATSLFLAFSKLTIEKNRDSVERMFRLSIKYTSLIVIPASFAWAVLSQELVYTLYGAQYKLAPSYLTVYAFSFLCAGLGTFVLSNFFNGQGDTRTTLRRDLVILSLSLLLVPISTMLYGVSGLIVSIVAAQLLSAIYGLYLARRRYGVSVDWTSYLKIGVASLFSALLVYIFLKFSPLSTPIYKLAAGGALYLATFLAFAPLLRAIDETDIKNLDELTRELTPIYPIARRILNLEEKILGITS